MNDIYRVSIDGGTPMPVSQDRYTNEFQAAPSPDGKVVAFAARGVASNQWWRRGSSHLDESSVWTLDLTRPNGYARQAGNGTARNVWPMWGADARSLYFVSDAQSENIWLADAESQQAASRPVTSFHDGRVLWPSITIDGKTIAFERNFGIWTLDTASRQAHQVPIVRRGVAASPPPERVRQTNRFENLALSPDGKKVAFIAHGDVFAASAKGAGDATRVTNTPAIESQPAWAPDSRRLVYVSARGDGQQLHLYDFASSTDTALTTGTATDLSPVFSPDGARVAYLRDRKELHVLDVASKQDRAIATGTFADTLDMPKPVWSPNGKWIALFAIGAKAFTNVDLVSVDTPGPPRPVSFLANAFASAIAWSPDGSFLLFDTRQRTEQGQIARVDLALRTPKFREDQFRDLFTSPTSPKSPESPTSAAPANPLNPVNPLKRVEPVFADIRQRLSLLPLGLDAGEAVLSPDGKTAVVLASAAGQTNLYSYSLDDLATDRPVARQLTTTAGPKGDAQFSPDGKEVYYLDAGRINIVSVDRRESRPLAVTAEYTVDFAAEKMTVFEQGWRLLADNFFDPAFDGVDWNASRKTYGARVAGASTPDEMRRVMSLMVGDLNASHLGVNPPGSVAPAPSVGRLGLRFDRQDYESNGRLRITEVIPLGPAAVTGSLAVGDIITGVDGKPSGAGANLDELLANPIDRRVVLTVQRAGASRDVVIRPANQATEKSLIYRAWVESNRDYVLKTSGGRLGYVHMINMSAAALDQLYIDLDTDNHIRDGVVIDIRNNTGGCVNAYAIDVFSRHSYLRMSTRNRPEAPARSVLGQRVLELPTALVTNQHSLSDAEDFSEGYRVLKLGPIVGEPTAGWIIYTWDTTLIDGTGFRLPRQRVKASDTTDMERHPRPVDTLVTRPIGETLTGKDSQLDEAIRALLKKLGRAE
jgi:Tol biopolymer transport system component/C-terminal processing protease CtpA/Prc